MRADRLLSILMLLQDRGRLTAQELANELEVSERTIYRDMVALSTAGVPVYAERGPGGGCSLIDSYRTNLTGLTRDEVRALFMLSVPAPLADLGVDQDLKTALLKLSAALPEVFRPEGIRVRQRIHLDSTPWFHQEVQVPHMHTIQGALWQDRKLNLTYRLAFDAHVEHIVEPYGLVAKTNTWHLIFSRAGVIFVRKLTDVLDAKLTQDRFDYPPDFDLVKFWTDWCRKYEDNQPQFTALVRLKQNLVHMLQHFKDPLITDITGEDKLDGDGWYIMTLHFETFEAARKRLLNFGGAAEALEPQALRSSIQDFAAQIQTVYNR
jgi:predicted DNA-binding transcriptional regulator YafY